MSEGLPTSLRVGGAAGGSAMTMPCVALWADEVVGQERMRSAVVGAAAAGGGNGLRLPSRGRVDRGHVLTTGTAVHTARHHRYTRLAA